MGAAASRTGQSHQSSDLNTQQPLNDRSQAANRAPSSYQQPRADKTSQSGSRTGANSKDRRLYPYEGGEEEDDDSTSSIDLDEVEPAQKDFVQDASAKRESRCRILIILLIAALQLCLLIIYSLEGIHNSKGHLIWVLTIFSAQLLSLFVVEPLYFLIIATIVSKIEARHREQAPDDDTYKIALARWFYDYLVLVEDWKHVLRFQTQRL